MSRKQLGGESRTPHGICRLAFMLPVLALALFGNSAYVCSAELTPNEIEFRRQAVPRIIFDRSQDILLAVLRPVEAGGFAGEQHHLAPGG